MLKKLGSLFIPKYYGELRYWKKCYKNENYTFENGHYLKYFLAISGFEDINFVENKVIADFGCGPRGSLTWAKNAKRRIGIDVLASEYKKYFGKTLETHNMEYIESIEKNIPLDNETVDILFSLNSFDHVNDFELMCSENLRILKTGGLFIGSFNINEPQTLTEEKIKKFLLDKMNVILYRVSNFADSGNKYQLLFDKKERYDFKSPGAIWVKATKI